MRIRIGCSVALLVLAAAGCSGMRVTGTVRDSETAAPIVGAVGGIDGRALVTSDFDGKYGLKTLARPSTLMVSAPCYRRATAPVEPGPDRYPVRDIQLERSGECGGTRQAER